MTKGPFLIDEATEALVRDQAADCGVAPEAVIKAAVDAFVKLDLDDQIHGIEAACEQIARSRGWRPKSEKPPRP